ncbi:MAG TPA: tartrate-resistant acid phosphatase type 5 family protein [Verrucomicrobiae bacterium]|nr:tartrate-resistant acid phosphatase type 5 family protein [Verrucomicrobiae bacterium]
MKQTRREFVRVLFVATQAAVIGRFLPDTLWAADVAYTPAGGLNFLVFGDWGRHGETDQVDVATQMGIAANAIKPQFIISVGDNFYEDGVTSTSDPQWQNSFENVYHSPSLQVPWYVALGNHDYRGNCDAQIAYGQLSQRWNMPARYFTQSRQIDAATTVDFFYLDTTPMVKSYWHEPGYREHVSTQDVPKQLAWFKAALAASTAPWKIVIGHHPIYSGGGILGHGDTRELIADVLPLLKQYQVQAYFNGHDHNLQHLKAGTVNLFDSGAGSRARPVFRTKYTKFAEACSGFTAVTLQADSMKVRMIDDRGRLLYTANIPRNLA